MPLILIALLPTLLALNMYFSMNSYFPMIVGIGFTLAILHKHGYLHFYRAGRRKAFYLLFLAPVCFELALLASKNFSFKVA